MYISLWIIKTYFRKNIKMRNVIRFLRRHNFTNDDHIDEIVKRVYHEVDHKPETEISDIWHVVHNYLAELEDSEASYLSVEEEEIEEVDPRQQQWLERIKVLKQKPQPAQRSPEWYELRANMFTASSDIANILGRGYEKGPAVYKHLMLKKNGHDLKGFKGNEATRWGQKYEDIICMVYSQRNDTKVEEFGLIQHDKHTFIGASPDGIGVEGKNAGIMLEIKCPFRRVITGIPKDYYLVQMLTQLEVCDLEFCDFAEATIQEYKNEEEFLEDSILDDPNKTKMDLEKGIIGEYYNTYISQKNPDNVKFCYPPLHLSPEEKKKWIQEQSFAGHEFRRFIYWKIEVYSCVRVVRDREWWADAFPKIQKAWEDVLSYRVDKKELITLLKRMKKGKDECMFLED